MIWKNTNTMKSNGFINRVGSDDQTIFKCFRVIFSLKKKTIQYSLSFNLYFQQKRAPKLSICHLPTKLSVWVFDVTNRANGFSNFQSYPGVVMYLFNSLTKTVRYFENSLKPLTKVIFSKQHNISNRWYETSQPGTVSF